MFNKLTILQTATAMARHAAERQSLIAENIANADTPGFKARDLEPFAEAYGRHGPQAGAPNATSRFRIETSSAPGAASPNGNTVSLEDQMWRSSSAMRDHETAMTLYSKSLSMLRSALGSGR